MEAKNVFFPVTKITNAQHIKTENVKRHKKIKEKTIIILTDILKYIQLMVYIRAEMYLTGREARTSLFSYFETVSHYVAMASLDMAMQTRLVQIQRSTAS